MTDANVPQLTYAIAPTVATVSTTQNFVLTLTNPNPTFAVTMKKATAGDQIQISNWSTLTASFGQISPVAPPGTNWRIGPGQGASYLKIWVGADTIIAAGASVSFKINNVIVDQTVGQASLSVLEIAGGQTANPPDIQIGKLGAELQIFAYVQPVTVRAGQTATLNWTIVKGQYVTVVPPLPPPDPRRYDRVGALDKPWSFAIPVLPFQDERQTEFTATVFQDAGTWKTAHVTVNLSPPIITMFSNDPQQPISIEGTLTLSWNTVYATGLTLTWTKTVGVDLSGTRTFTSAELKKMVSNGQTELVFTLKAAGFRTPATSRLTIALQPVAINWFRFADLEHRALTYDVTNATAVSLPAISGPAPYQLTAQGPFGPVSQILAGNDVEVLVLYADPPSVASGQPTTLHFQVQNAASASLNPGNQPLMIDANGIGEIVVSPAATTKYTVVARDALGNQAASPLTVPVAATVQTSGARRTPAKRPRAKGTKR
jgi:hypothetical protein